MGEELAETSDEVSNDENGTFTTARLWGLCDTEPYLHDGRAFTLNEAIEAHGGEAQWIRDQYVLGLSDYEKNLVLKFLCSLRTPRLTSTGILKAPEAAEETDAQTLLDVYEEETAGLELYEEPAG